jgi:hypothetical protein
LWFACRGGLLSPAKAFDCVLELGDAPLEERDTVDERRLAERSGRARLTSDGVHDDAEDEQYQESRHAPK